MKKTAEELAKEQKEISISEFFEKNKHLLGFDNPTKALLMSVKEGMDNALDACEEAGILPDVTVKIKNIGEDKFRVSIQDNGPGIVKNQIPRVFGKLLYGSKFHRLKQNRGQQGLGISMVVLYSQLTTGKSTRVWSKVDGKGKTYYYELLIDTIKNEPEIVKEEEKEDSLDNHGLRVELDIIGRYRKVQGVDDYLKQTSIANPFARITYYPPEGNKIVFQRTVDALPERAKSMKSHPYGIEFGILLRMLGRTKSKSLSAFLSGDFSSVGQQSAKQICKLARLNASQKPSLLTRDEIEKLLNAMQKVRIQRPPLDCLSPISKEGLEKSLKREYPDAEFISTITREPEVYRGNPFIIECGVVYGVGDELDVIRFANRVPLLYQAGACGISEAIKDVDWKRYGLQMSGNLPIGPIKLIVHMCSVWVPFISESKEAIAPYPEIVKEIKLAVQDASRNLSRFLSGKRRFGEQKRRILIFERYAVELAEALEKLTKRDKKNIESKLKGLINRKGYAELQEGQEKEENGLKNVKNE